MAVHQSSVEAPPLNRRTILPAMNPFPVDVPGAASEARTASGHWAMTNESLSPDAAFNGVRLELKGEIEQVKGDLFGAAMGVSALKDRLDGLESQMTQKQAYPAPTQSPPTREDIESWVAAWLDVHLPPALDRAASASQQNALGALSTQTWFRQPVTFPPADRHTFLAQPPTILASTPV